MDEQCVNCKFYFQAEAYRGQCRLDPPRVRNPYDGLGVFPIVNPEMWCGEWEAQPEPEEKK